MKFKTSLFIIGFLSQAVFLAQNGDVEIRGKISAEGDSRNSIKFFKSKLSFNDSIFFTEACDTNGNFKFLVSEKFIKNYKTLVSVYQDVELLKKNYPTKTSCPFFNTNGEAYMTPAPIELQYKLGTEVYPAKFILPPACFLPKMNFIGFKRNTLDLERYKEVSSDTTLICIAGTLQQNPEIVIEVVGFSWREKHPEQLAQQRAKLIKNKLVKLGIDSTRILTRSEGELRPIATTLEVSTVNHSREEILKLFAVNRRVEINILSFDYDPKSKKRSESK